MLWRGKLAFPNKPMQRISLVQCGVCRADCVAAGGFSRIALRDRIRRYLHDGKPSSGLSSSLFHGAQLWSVSMEEKETTWGISTTPMLCSTSRVRVVHVSGDLLVSLGTPKSGSKPGLYWSPVSREDVSSYVTAYGDRMGCVIGRRGMGGWDKGLTQRLGKGKLAGGSLLTHGFFCDRDSFPLARAPPQRLFL